MMKTNPTPTTPAEYVAELLNELQLSEDDVTIEHFNPPTGAVLRWRQYGAWVDGDDCIEWELVEPAILTRRPTRMLLVVTVPKSKLQLSP